MAFSLAMTNLSQMGSGHNPVEGSGRSSPMILQAANVSSVSLADVLPPRLHRALLGRIKNSNTLVAQFACPRCASDTGYLSHTDSARQRVTLGCTNQECRASEAELLKELELIPDDLILVLDSAKRPWKIPLPLEKHTVPSFPTRVLPLWLRTWTENEALATQTPLDLAATLALAVLAGILQRKVEIRIRDGWKETASLYVVCALDPGNRKTAVCNDATAPLEEYERELVLTQKPKIAEARAKRELLEERYKRVMAQAAKDNSERLKNEAEAVELAQTIDGMAEIVEPKLIVNDCSPERLETLLAEHGGRMAVFSDEGNIFDIMQGRYAKQGILNLGVFLQAHTGSNIRVDRMSRRAVFVKEPTLTIGISIQPEVIRGAMKRQEFRGRGLLARFLYSVPTSLLGARAPDAPTLPPAVREAYNRNIRSLLELPFSTDGEGNPAPYTIRFSGAAKEELYGFMRELERMFTPFGELVDLKDWGAKLAGAVARIAGLLHIADRSSSLSPWHEEINPETVQRAILVGYYFIPHAKAAFALLGSDPETEAAKHILAWIQRKGVLTISRRDIFNGVRGTFKRVRDINAPIRLLVEQEYLREKPNVAEKTAGRPPSPEYEVNPLPADDSADIADIADSKINTRSPLEEDTSSLKASASDSVSYTQYPHNEQNAPPGAETAEQVVQEVFGNDARLEDSPFQDPPPTQPAQPSPPLASSSEGEADTDAEWGPELTSEELRHVRE